MGNNHQQNNIEYVINNIDKFSTDELLKFDFCKLLKTLRYTSLNIIVFRNGKFYSLVRDKFLSTRRSKGKGYLTIYIKNDEGKTTTMIVPYIICYLFRNDYLKHGKYEKNYFEYVDGDLNNCDADNIRANYYYYKILQHVSEDVVSVEMCGYEVLVNLDFYKNELHKYRFRKICNGNCVYFLSENSGKNIRLHQVVMNYYNPNMTITGVIDHINHNTLDNTIDNLRHVNHIINSMNNMKLHPCGMRIIIRGILDIKLMELDIAKDFLSTNIKLNN